MTRGSSRWNPVALLVAVAATIQPARALAVSAYEESASAPRSAAVVARVNGQPIYEDQLTPQIQAQLHLFRKSGAESPSQEMMRSVKQKALDRLIGVELLRQASQDLEVPDIEKRIDRKVDEMGMTDASGPEGMGDDEIRASIGRQIRVQEYLLKNGLLDPAISEEEIEAYYEKNKWAFASKGSYRARDILRAFDPNGTAAERREARRVIEEARQLILDGKPFEEVAKQYSESETASAGGNLGPREKGSMPPEFEAAVFSLDLGKLSDVIETRYGYHILEVLERTPEGTVPSYAETRDFIATILEKQASPGRIAAHVQQLREKAAVEILLE
jgi:peptidyl-prolyl cis-trans isomerase C